VPSHVISQSLYQSIKGTTDESAFAQEISPDKRSEWKTPYLGRHAAEQANTMVNAWPNLGIVQEMPAIKIGGTDYTVQACDQDP
jgi:hypothetical protein